MSELIARARDFAVQAHARINHRRKYTHQPYEVHLKHVARLVAEVTDDEVTVAAAWLHDTLEDTPATWEDIEESFGGEVATVVAELTDVSRPSDGNRAVRKALDRAHLARAGNRAKTVKLADLIDNLRDISANDAKFARVFVTEAVALIEVLEGGDPRLMARARKVLAESAAALGLAGLAAPSLELGDELDRPAAAWDAVPARVTQLFATGFRASDIVEPLHSFDSVRSPAELVRLLGDLGLAVAGIRIDGEVRGFVTQDDLDASGSRMRTFAADQLLEADAPLSDAVHALNRHEHCFVTLLGHIVGVITRADFLKPVVRMWLFGIVTVVEMEVTSRVRALWPDEAWSGLVSPARLAKAQELHAERLRRGHHCELVDCLQYSDKVKLLLEEPEAMAEFGFSTRGLAKRRAKEMESLRNNLAHAQDIVAYDWPQIVRLA
ncbi:MAG: HD domain-containing protein, partial [Gammaproteobacteria bacterium]